MRYFGAKRSDLSASPTNAHGSWSVGFIALKRALEAGSPEETLAALKAWLAQRGINNVQTELGKIISLAGEEGKPYDWDKVYAALGALVGPGWDTAQFTPELKQKLVDTLRLFARDHVDMEQQRLDVATRRLGDVRSRYSLESTNLVASLLK